MRYSIIISYRDREEHLSTLLPRLQELFQDKTYEIIIAEQDNKDKFQKNSLYNLAAQKANGELLIFHDVDYYPTDNVSYDTEPDIPLYPVRKVTFLDNNNQPRDYYNTPAGYRNFSNDVGDHSGGVFVLHKDLFYKMNGLNPYYIGWGKEDDDTRDRLKLLGYNWKRNEQGTFYGLYHEDNKPDDNDPDFINNHIILANINKTLDSGYKNTNGTIEEFSAGDNVRWLKINDLILF